MWKTEVVPIDKFVRGCGFQVVQLQKFSNELRVSLVQARFTMKFPLEIHVSFHCVRLTEPQLRIGRLERLLDMEYPHFATSRCTGELLLAHTLF